MASGSSNVSAVSQDVEFFVQCDSDERVDGVEDGRSQVSPDQGITNVDFVVQSRKFEGPFFGQKKMYLMLNNYRLSIFTKYFLYFSATVFI